jgi:hypothetical protein
MKTSRKYVFHPCEAHIPVRLENTVLYISFLGFEKCRVLAQNLKGLAFGFIEKHLFTVKASQKLVFHACEAHILSWLDITVL